MARDDAAEATVKLICVSYLAECSWARKYGFQTFQWPIPVPHPLPWMQSGHANVAFRRFSGRFRCRIPCRGCRVGHVKWLSDVSVADSGAAPPAVDAEWGTLKKLSDVSVADHGAAPPAVDAEWGTQMLLSDVSVADSGAAPPAVYAEWGTQMLLPGGSVADSGAALGERVRETVEEKGISMNV